MAHYAKIVEGKVINIITADESFFDTFYDDSPAQWIQTSYNTKYGQHKLGGTPLRKNFAGVGHIYDATRDAFYEPQPYTSWTLNETTCQWEAPVAYPNDGNVYEWNESDQQWDEVSI
jgi:hypothetical protein|tara:strand:+ start:61 stop:411 length:351 start_codon:yes stop_codon:yes gene_type:complete